MEGFTLLSSWKNHQATYITDFYLARSIHRLRGQGWSWRMGNYSSVTRDSMWCAKKAAEICICGRKICFGPCQKPTVCVKEARYGSNIYNRVFYTEKATLRRQDVHEIRMSVAWGLKFLARLLLVASYCLNLVEIFRGSPLRNIYLCYSKSNHI